MRNTITPDEAVQSAVHLVDREVSAGLSLPVALQVVAGRHGIDAGKLQYFYHLNKGYRSK